MRLSLSSGVGCDARCFSDSHVVHIRLYTLSFSACAGSVWPARSDLAAVGSGASEQKPAPQSRLTTWDEDEDAVLPMIPDLEEVQEEDLALQVAAAPRLAAAGRSARDTV